MFPIVEETPVYLPPRHVFDSLKNRPFCFLLDSGMDPGKLGRFTFMGSEPFLIFKSTGRNISIIQGGQTKALQGNPFDVLGELLANFPLEKNSCPVPFTGGAVGYFSYDLCHFIEKLPASCIDDLRLPECYFAFYDAIIAYDLLAGKSFIVSTGYPETANSNRAERAEKRTAELKDLIYEAFCRRQQSDQDTSRGKEDILLKSNFSREEYLSAVEKARQYIIAGDIFQVNLSQRFESDLKIAPYELYERLRQVNPAPFAGYLDFRDVAVVSASPERFLKLSGDLVETRPIKGTRPRGASAARDEAMAEELLASKKDKAENTMIVDLERNDLGRVCEYGTVRVTEWAILETFPTVFHLTSTVTGKLRPDKNRVDLLKASFPGGSITGAPKVRAMEIIDELEPTRRSVYTGSMGYLGFNGDMDLNIVIRTFLVKNNRAYFQVGGGIVFDSEPVEEYKETLDKARALILALEISSKVEMVVK
ncbi:MAG: aminodeoxychorismate synthase component I [Dehalococcoidia bacterium]|nr:aminodeoxychorismate synthase component I [Dehalococcoidia bacterium]